jgi:hypothetical protein
MSAITIAIVLAGLVAVGLTAASRGVDVIAVILIALIVALGTLSVVVAGKSRSGAVRPASCGECGSLNSSTAPYCKHCGAKLG